MSPFQASFFAPRLKSQKTVLAPVLPMSMTKCLEMEEAIHKTATGETSLDILHSKMLMGRATHYHQESTGI